MKTIDLIVHGRSKPETFFVTLRSPPSDINLRSVTNIGHICSFVIDINKDNMSVNSNLYVISSKQT